MRVRTEPTPTTQQNGDNGVVISKSATNTQSTQTMPVMPVQSVRRANKDDFNAHQDRHSPVLRIILSFVMSVVLLAVAVVTYVGLIWKGYVPITVHSNGYDGVITASVSRDGSDDVLKTIDVSDGEMETVLLGYGHYTVTFKPTYPLLADGTHSLKSHDDMSITMLPWSDNVIDVTLDTVDVTDDKAIDEALNTTPAKYQDEASDKYAELHDEATKSVANQGKDTDEYSVTDVTLQSTTGNVKVSASFHNKLSRSMQWMEVHFDLMDSTGRKVGTASYQSDLLYAGTSVDIVADGFTSDTVAYAVVSDVIWY